MITAFFDCANSDNGRFGSQSRFRFLMIEIALRSTIIVDEERAGRGRHD